MNDEPLVSLLQDLAMEADFGCMRVNVVCDNVGRAVATARKFHAIANDLGFSPVTVSNFVVKLGYCRYYFWAADTWRSMPQNLGLTIVVAEELGTPQIMDGELCASPESC